MKKPRTVLTVGNFDGVHLGHQALVKAARTLADRTDASVGVLTFARHPVTTLRPDATPQMLTHNDYRESQLLAAGADFVEWQEPSAEFLDRNPTEFIQWLWERFDLVGVVEGMNFRFGRNRMGGVDTLEAIGLEMGFDVQLIESVDVALTDKSVHRVSSSLVRWLISEGRVADVGRCLNRPYAIAGKVVVGDQRGRSIGVPTLNIDPEGQMLPQQGVYAASTEVDGVRYPVALSIGNKPTFSGEGVVCEAHLIGFSGDLYGRRVSVDCHRWMRDQQVFPSVEDLIGQLQFDISTVRRYFDSDMLSVPVLSA